MSKKLEYTFDKEIQKKLKGFETYLNKLGSGINSIRQKTNYTGYFLNWVETEHLQVNQTRYNDLLNFIDYCKKQGKSKRLINRKLSSIRNYYQYLKIKNPSIINPALNLYLKGVRQNLPSGIINYIELEKLYHNLKTSNNREKRNKVILGLLVYQGVSTDDLKQLETTHLRLKKGIIYLPGNLKRNSRTVELKPFQILEIHEYLNEIRPLIIKEITHPKPARKPDVINKQRIKDQLFISLNGSENIKNSLLHMFNNLKKINPTIKNPKQIRASVITYWLKSYNLREVQYFAGHKYVSSTERYQINNLDNLQTKLEKLHPLSDTSTPL